MPFVDGESLRDRLQREGRLPIAEAARLLREVVDALAHAHRAGIIHRDVKPDNVLLADRHVSLADFGVAHALAAHVGEDQTVTGTSVMVGTPAYMSPEQVTAAAIDGRSDIYAFGVMAYELAGRRAAVSRHASGRRDRSPDRVACSADHASCRDAPPRWRTPSCGAFTRSRTSDGSASTTCSRSSTPSRRSRGRRRTRGPRRAAADGCSRR